MIPSYYSNRRVPLRKRLTVLGFEIGGYLCLIAVLIFVLYRT